MNPKIKKLHNLLQSLPIEQKKKKSLCDRLKNQQFSKKLFNEIDQVLAEEKEKSDQRLEKIHADIEIAEENLQKTKKDVKVKKQELFVEHRKTLKKIYDESIIEFKETAKKIDQNAEATQHKNEEEEIAQINKELEIDNKE